MKPNTGTAAGEEEEEEEVLTAPMILHKQPNNSE